MKPRTDTIEGPCPACGHEVRTTIATDPDGGCHRLTIHIHPRTSGATRCKHDAGPEPAGMALEKFPGDT